MGTLVVLLITVFVQVVKVCQGERDKTLVRISLECGPEGNDSNRESQFNTATTLTKRVRTFTNKIDGSICVTQRYEPQTSMWENSW